EVAFLVKPVQVSISQQRKVMVYSQGLKVPLHAKVELNGKPPIEDSEQVLDLGNGVTAKVKNVDWKTITNPSDGVCELKIETNLLVPTVEFKAQGALTALATVTIAISKDVKKQQNELAKPKVIEETFVLPAVSADLWAVQTPEWKNVEGRLATQALALAGRTFLIEEGNFIFQGKTHNWNAETGISPKITLEPALESASIPPPPVQKVITLPIVCSDIKISWFGPNNQTSNVNRFVPFFKEVGNAQVELNTALNFDTAEAISFASKAFSIQAFSLSDLVDAYIDPSSFTIAAGGKKPLTFVIKQKQIPSEIFVLSNAYKVIFPEVSWYANDEFLGKGNPFEFHATPVKRQSTIKAVSSCNITESDIEPGFKGGKDEILRKAVYTVVTLDVTNIEIYIPETETDSQWEDANNKISWERIVFDGESIKVKVTLSVEIPSLDILKIPIKIRAFSDWSDTEDWKEITINSDDRLSSNNKSIYLTITWNEAVSLGLFPPKDTVKFTSADLIKNPVDSNFNDSNKFDEDMYGAGYKRCGMARDLGGIASYPPALPVNADFLKTGGVLYFHVTADIKTSLISSIQYQADTLYYSGHGNHQTGEILGGNFSPNDAKSYWNKDLDMAIIAGCSVFDIKDYAGHFPATSSSHFDSPGEKWIGAGPQKFLGYAYTAPLDNQGGDPETTSRIIHDWFTGGKTVDSWMDANANKSGWNACAIDLNKAPWEYHYFKPYDLPGGYHYHEKRKVVYDTTNQKWPDLDP
ncbi:hypothetical protein HYY75_03770, partial [bacterium]|nr:hypothetical protein [bacterium]